MSTKKSIVSLVTDLKIANGEKVELKTPKAKKGTTVKPTEQHLQSIRDYGKCFLTTAKNTAENATLRLEMDKIAGDLHKAKLVVGDTRNCPVAKEFSKVLVAYSYTDKEGKEIKLPVQTMKNYMGCFRAAVESGKAITDLNQYRAKKDKEDKKEGNTRVLVDADYHEKVMVLLKSPFNVNDGKAFKKFCDSIGKNVHAAFCEAFLKEGIGVAKSEDGLTFKAAKTGK